MTNKKYRFSEDIKESYPELLNRTFTKSQLHEVYRDIVDKEEYPDFECWLHDMEKSGLVTEVNKARHMNTNELTHELFNMASNQNKYNLVTCTAIINAIIVQYLTTAGYYEENAVETFKGFLENGILEW